MSIQLLDIPCPKCEALCWVNNGNVDDMTLPDVEAIECWKCNHYFWMEHSSYQPENYAEKSYKTSKEALEN